MPLRLFGNTGADFIELNIGAAGVTGDASYVALAKMEFPALGTFVSYLDSGSDHQAQFYDFSTEGYLIQIYINPSGSAAIDTSELENVFCLFGATKPSGTHPARFHLYRFDTEEFIHADAAGSIGNSPANPGGFIQLGRWGVTEQLEGVLAAAAVWKRVLSDKEFEELVESTYLIDWDSEFNPDALWLLNQKNVSEKVIDRTGNGADQIASGGTEVIAGEPPIPFEEGGGGGVLIDVGGALVMGKRFMDVGGILVPV